MKKLLVLSFFLVYKVTSFAQFPNVSNPISNSRTIYQIPVLRTINAFMLPVEDTLNNLATPYLGAVTILPSDSAAGNPIVYITNGTYWSVWAGSGLGGDGDTLVIAEGLYVTQESGQQVLHGSRETTVDGLRLTTNPQIDVIYVTTDMGGGLWKWDDASTATDNTGTIVKITDITTGRFIRIFSGDINVRWFGAVGDGATNDAAAIQAAIDYASSLSSLFAGPGFDFRDTYGATVYFPSGRWLINSTIIWKNGVKLKGSGKRSTAILINTGTTIDGFVNLVPPTGSSYAIIAAQDISFYGHFSGATRNTRDLISLNFARVYFNDVDVLYAGRHAVLYDATIDATFTRCQFGNSNSHNFRLNQSDTVSTTVRFNDCYFKASINGSGIMIENILGATFNSCIFESNGSSLADNDSCGWGAISKKGHITFNQPYAENNYRGVLWLGQTRVQPISTFNGNRYYVYGLTHVNQNFKPAVRVDEAEMVVIRGDRHNNISTTGRALYQFYPKYALSYSIETSVTESSVQFYHQDTDTLIDMDKVPYLSWLTTAYSGDRNAYLGSRAIIHGKELRITGDLIAPANVYFDNGIIEDATGYVGIGTTTPPVPLSIQGQSLGALQVYEAGQSGTWWKMRVAYNVSNPDMIWGTGTGTDAMTERFRFNNLGYLGLGKNAPTSYLDIKAGTTLVAPAKLSKGSLVATIAGGVNDGAIEYDSLTNRFYVTIGSTRYTVDNRVGQIEGTATNNNASAGNVGEYVSSVVAVGSAVSLTTNTTANVTSVSLSAGDWDVTGVVDFSLSGTTATDFQFGSNNVSATIGAQDTYLEKPFQFTTLTSTYADAVPITRYSLASTTTIYLVARSTFSAGTIAVFGTLRCRRAR